nr:ATP-binding protein [Bradyrhizobium sp. 143]
MGVAADERLLPASLQSAADIVVRIPPPDGAVLRRAITRFARRSPGELDAGIAAGLDLSEIVAAFRPGTGAQAVARRLEAARRSHAGPTVRVPELATAIEYGVARTFGLNLAKDLENFRRNLVGWRDIDRGICLYSIPGCGKSWFPAVLSAGCGGIPLVSTSVGAWFANGPGFLDSVIKEMRKSHQLAVARAAPISIWHIDEVDALPDRAKLSSRALEWWNVLVSDALNLIDSALAAKDSKIIVIGSTNAIERVDPALLRPGRLEKVVEIEPPDAAGAVNVARFHLDGELAGEDLTGVGALLEGSTPAEIMYIVRTARRAARHAGRALAVGDLMDAAMPTEAHPPARLFRMSIHEAAHVVAALALSAGTVERVFLRTSGGAGGRTEVHYPDGDLPTRETIEDRVVVALAARAAERLFTGSVSTGGGGAADSDLGFATMHVASLHASFGLAGAPIYLGAETDLLNAVAFDPDLRERVGRDLRRLEARAFRLVEANRAAILAVAARLAEKRHLERAEIEAIVRAHPGPASGRRVRRARSAGPKTNP